LPPGRWQCGRGCVIMNKLECLKWGESPSNIIAWNHAIGTLGGSGPLGDPVLLANWLGELNREMFKEAYRGEPYSLARGEIC
jgi:hypothetical protein